MFGKLNGKDKGGNGKEFAPVNCSVCNDQGSVYEASNAAGEKIISCPSCGDGNEIEDQPGGELTMGEYLVGLDFNPGGKPEVTAVKTDTAAVMDGLHEFMLSQMEEGGNDAAGRCAAVALSKYEEACMWAVKAYTKPPFGV